MNAGTSCAYFTRGLWSPQEQYAQHRQLRAREFEFLGHPVMQFMLVFRHSVMAGLPARYQRFIDETVKRGFQIFRDKFHYRVSTRFLVAGQEQAVQGERVY